MLATGSRRSTPSTVTVAGNILLLSDAITLLTAGPQGTMTINADAAYTSATDVTIDSAVTGATEMRFSNDGVFDTETFEAFAATKTWTLPAGDGIKTVYAEFRDGAGNTLARSDAITLDTAAPTGTISINAGSTDTSKTAVSLTLSAADGAGSGVAKMRLSNDGVYDTEVWEDFAASKAWTT